MQTATRGSATSAGPEESGAPLWRPACLPMTSLTPTGLRAEAPRILHRHDGFVGTR